MAHQVRADLDAIRELQLALGKFNSGSATILSQVASELSTVSERLEARVRHWQLELRKREARLESCVAGRRGDCRSERAAVEEALEALKTLQRFAVVLEKAKGEYRSQENRFKQALTVATQKGGSDLGRSLVKYEGYLSSGQEPTVLRQGKIVHRQVEQDWKDNTSEGTVETEYSITKPSGRTGRIDVLITGDEGQTGVVEIKNTNWNNIAEGSVSHNVSRQANQVWDYIDSQVSLGREVSPGIYFAQTPSDPARKALIEQLFDERGISVVWGS